MIKENDILEETLSIAENGYEKAYWYLLDVYEHNAERCGAQTLYFLACLAGGAGMTATSLDWLRKAIAENGWWYRPEVLCDDDLDKLRDDTEFILLKALSDGRYRAAAEKTKALFSWEKKTAENLFLAVHGNTQNAETAREDWAPMLGADSRWQTETVQSGEPDGYGTYRWSYDNTSYLPLAGAIEKVRGEGYKRIVCGGFSAGCDMLLRAAVFSPARCDTLILQSPWIPLLGDHEKEITEALGQKDIKLIISCGSDDDDCLPMAKDLYNAVRKAGLCANLFIHKNDRHRFPNEPSVSLDLL